MSAIRVVYTVEPTFPATDQHPDAVRYQVGGFFVDAIGGEPSLADVLAVVSPLSQTATTNGDALAERQRDSRKADVAGLIDKANFTTSQREILDAILELIP